MFISILGRGSGSLICGRSCVRFGIILGIRNCYRIAVMAGIFLDFSMGISAGDCLEILTFLLLSDY